MITRRRKRRKRMNRDEVEKEKGEELFTIMFDTLYKRLDQYTYPWFKNTLSNVQAILVVYQQISSSFETFQ